MYTPQTIPRLGKGNKVKRVTSRSGWLAVGALSLVSSFLVYESVDKPS